MRVDRGGECIKGGRGPERELTRIEGRKYLCREKRRGISTFGALLRRVGVARKAGKKTDKPAENRENELALAS